MFLAQEKRQKCKTFKKKKKKETYSTGAKMSLKYRQQFVDMTKTYMASHTKEPKEYTQNKQSILTTRYPCIEFRLYFATGPNSNRPTMIQHYSTF
jgi:hypothetical protein